MRVLALIPARAGSKGIPGKNERPLAGRTLVERAADAARESGVVDSIALTTDSPAIAEIGYGAGIDVVMRPPELALDETPMAPVVVHALEQLSRDGERWDALALLQPTQPLRRPAHLGTAVRMLEDDRSATSVVSVVEIPAHFAPQYAMRVEGARLVPYLPEGAGLTRRQDVEAAYSRDGTVYLVRADLARHGDLYGTDCRPLVIAPADSVNLDSPADWARAEELLRS